MHVCICNMCGGDMNSKAQLLLKVKLEQEIEILKQNFEDKLKEHQINNTKPQD